VETGIRLLMIEDVKEEAELASAQLRRAGVEHVIERVDTEEGLRTALDTFDPSLILSDFTLPRFDGMSALRIASDLRPETPFVFFSGTIGEERAIEALKSGAVDYVLKGNPGRLASSVRRALGERGERVARKRAERMLRDSEERFRAIVESSADWIWETDTEGRHVFCNPFAEAFFGRTRAELLGAPHGEFLHPDEQARFRQLLQESVARRSGWRGLVLRWRDRQGTIRWLESNAVACFDDSGRLLGFRGVDRDITERRRDEERIRRLSRVHAMLSNTNSTIMRTRDRTELLREACRIAVTHGQYAVAWAGIIDENLAALVKCACAGAHCDLFGEGPYSLALSSRGAESLLLRAAHTRQPVLVDRTHEGASGLRRELSGMGLDGLVALPLVVGEEAAGVFALAATSSQVFDDGEIKLLQELAGDLAFALQYLRQEAHLRFLAHFDTLTGLANREMIALRLQEFIEARTDATVAIALFDVDRLSQINHALGRHRGDQLLRQLASRLRSHLPEGIRAGYSGGGVFAVIFPALAGEAAAFLVQDWFDEKILAEAFVLDGQELRMTGHLGVALYPGDGDDATALLGSAEIALRNAKSSGERFMYSSPELNERVARRVTLENRLRAALEREQFALHLQPKVAIATGTVTGFEALLRWPAPEGQEISPETFVPLLEETGLIEPVGEWVVRRASDLQAEWRAAGLAARIAVNVSARQLKRPDFARYLRSLLDSRAGNDPGIDLEVTESTLLADIEGSVQSLREVRAMGLRIAIDDFGTGYSSLAQLVRLPVDTLKIDRSFVHGMSADTNVIAVIATIASLADALGLNTVAEGVETKEQLDRLGKLGVAEYQGFLFSGPVPSDTATELLRQKEKKKESRKNG